MKKLFFLFSFLIFYSQVKAQVIYGANNYTQYHIGTLPIIISVPHGGLLTPDGLPDRTCNNPTIDLDSKTIELARQIDTALFNLTGCHPHLIICNLRRTKVDCNRNIEDGACGNVDAASTWTDFHDFIDTAQFLSQNLYGSKALYIDLHGHGKQPYRLELGYGLSGEAFNNTDSILNTTPFITASSIENLVNTNVNAFTHSQLLRGPSALGTLFANAGFPAVPSQQAPNTGGFPYFSGGYNTSNYTCLASGSNFDGLQLECDSTIRFGYSNRKKFADSTAIILSNYLFLHHNLNLQSNCGLSTNISENAILNNNKINFFPNPVTDILQLSTEKMNGEFEIELINTFGEVVLKVTNQNQLNISQLSKGIYFIRISNNQNDTWNGKIVKE